ncbi:IclR family transcriptional regulator [Tsukamurella soli]|uniref:IclR family transcriptional regulator n=1 Tax=Tsukamurella soli TaxID=644556 RepID=A0ABP8KCC3_9ACTN
MTLSSGTVAPGAPTRTATGSVTVRALRLLESFTAERPELSLSELARRSGTPLSTVHRLVGDLMEWGALERDPSTGRIRVGLRLWEVASLAPRALSLREAAIPVLEDVAAVTHENVQLGVREGDEVVFVERIRGRRSVRLLTRVGGRFALPPTGIGLALLAHAPADVQERVCAGPLRRFTPYTVTDPVRLRAMLAEVRRSGVAVSDRQVTDDAVSVAAPVFDRSRAIRAAVSVVVEADTGRPAQLTPLVRAAALSIGRALG